MITEGTTAGCTQASNLIAGLTAERLLADKGYDSDAIVEQAIKSGNASGDFSTKESHNWSRIR